MKKYSILLLTFCFFSSPSYAFSTIEILMWQQVELATDLSFRGSAILGRSMWVTGSNNSVFVSQDGGKTWRNKSVNSTPETDFRDIEIFDAHTAIVMGVGNGEQSKLYKTIDGGNNWQLLYQNEDQQGFFDSIAFWDNKQGLLMGDPIDGYYVVKKTQDGGKTWRRIAKHKLPALNKKEAAFAASGNTMIVGKNGKAWITTGGFSASVYVSEDFGESWQRQTVPLYNETKYAGGYGLALNHLEQLFVMGGDFEQRPKNYQNLAIYKSSQWSAVDAGMRGLRTAMSCQGKICVSVGKTGNDYSLNHGETWSAFDGCRGEKNDYGFYTIVSDNNVFLAAGTAGKVGIFKVSQYPEIATYNVYSCDKKQYKIGKLVEE